MTNVINWGVAMTCDRVVRKLVSAPISAETFIAPKLDDLGIVPRQHWKTGMLVHVKKEKSDYGMVSITDSYIGVLLEKDGDTVHVWPLAGTSTYHGRIKVNVSSITTSSSYAHQYINVQTASARCVRLVVPAALPATWWDTANTFLVNRKPYLAGLRPNVFARLAGYEAAKLAGTRWAASFNWGLKKQFISHGKVNAKGIQKFAQFATEKDGAGFDNYTRLQQMTLGDPAANYWNEGGHRPRIHSADCGHLYMDGLSTTHNVYSYGGPDSKCVCDFCYTNRVGLREVVLPTGIRTLADSALNVYNWSDGTLRLHREPELIGNYHESKNYVGPMPTLDGREFNGLTIGIELEMECSSSSTAKQCAAKLKGRLESAIPNTWHERGVSQRYGFFERDGSINNGFEMVTSYGPIEVHRHFISRAFGPDQPGGNMPFAGMLHSHDAGNCGLHVHMAKPDTLSHAAKLQGFYNDPCNAKLVKAVARRYDCSYARVTGDNTLANVPAKTTKALRDVGFGASYAKMYRKDKNYQVKAFKDRSIKALGEDNRYNQVNFMPSMTVEIRSFKGSMLPVTILACIEFAQASWFFTRDHVATDLTTENFIAYISAVNQRKDTAYLRAYLSARGFRCWMPRPDVKKPAVEHDFSALTC